MDSRDLKIAGAMIFFAGLGTVVGWVWFVESYDIIACGVIGMVVGQFLAMWWTRQKAKNEDTGEST